MKLKISVAVDFNKLANEMPKLIETTLLDYAKDSAKGSRENIDKGLKPPLGKVTKEIRESRTQPISPPLKATGALYNSIKATNKGVQMLSYGFLHEKGFITAPKSMIPNKKVDARPFISATKDGFKKIIDNFYRRSKQALRRKTPLVLET
jgi:phage gpG-like protein